MTHHLAYGYVGGMAHTFCWKQVPASEASPDPVRCTCPDCRAALTRHMVTGPLSAGDLILARMGWYGPLCPCEWCAHEGWEQGHGQGVS